MSTRIPNLGRFLNRDAPKIFTFNGKSFNGFQGDTLASSLLANDQMMVGRSFKYHRPRGIMASGAEEPNALMNMGHGARFEPNQRSTTTELFDGLKADSQNHWPSLKYDVGVINNYVSRVLPAGFYYKTFMFPRVAWKNVFEPIVRRSAGLGKPTKERDADRYEHFYYFTDILIIGGGIAGLQATLAAASSGAKTLLIEQTANWGGRAPVDGAEIAGKPAQDWIDETLAKLKTMKNVTIRNRIMGAGVYDHGYALGYEQVTDHQPETDAPRHRLWRIRAKQIITATGAIERSLSFAGNDIPGVMLASAVRDYLLNWGVAIGQRTVIVTNNDDAYRTAIALKEAGLEVPAIIDARASVEGDLPKQARALGIEIYQGRAIAKVKGGRRVTGVAISLQSGDGGARQEIKCDCVAMSGGFSPVVHLWSHCGGKLNWINDQAHFAPDPKRPPTGDDGLGFVSTAGIASGAMDTPDVLANANKAGKAAAKAAGFTPKRTGAPNARATAEAPMAPVWIMPAKATQQLRANMWLDFQNDVKVSDVQLAAQEGYESVEHTKRYTTLGMATDQGKLSNINGLAVLSDALDQPIPQTGTTTFRPPYTPISMGAIAGEARGEIFQPLRRTPMHDWHEKQGAYMEPVGHWRRPYCYPRGAESHQEAVTREVNNTGKPLVYLMLLHWES